MQTPWGPLRVSDAHVHFFSHRFFSALTEQKAEALAPVLGWQIPAPEPELLAEAWAHELDRHGVESAALISSIPGDEDSVAAAVERFPEKFYGYFMVNPTADGAANRVAIMVHNAHEARRFCVALTNLQFQSNGDVTVCTGARTASNIEQTPIRQIWEQGSKLWESELSNIVPASDWKARVEMASNSSTETTVK